MSNVVFMPVVHPVNGFYKFFYRSDVHEKMNCIRCQTYHDTPQSLAEGDINQSTHNSSEFSPEISDIGGFAEIAGCLQRLKSSEKQVGDIYFIVVIVHRYYTNSLLLFHF